MRHCAQASGSFCRTAQGPPIRHEDVLHDDPRRPGVKMPDVWIKNAVTKLLKAVKVEKNQFLFIHKNTAIAGGDLVIRKVPWREICAFMLQHHRAIEKSGPLVQIFLVAISPRFFAVIAPFDTFLAPPLDAGEALLIATKSDPTDIVNADFFPLLERGRKAMADDGNRTTAHFGKNGFRAFEKRTGQSPDKSPQNQRQDSALRKQNFTSDGVHVK